MHFFRVRCENNNSKTKSKCLVSNCFLIDEICMDKDPLKRVYKVWFNVCHIVEDLFFLFLNVLGFLEFDPNGPERVPFSLGPDNDNSTTLVTHRTDILLQINLIAFLSVKANNNGEVRIGIGDGHITDQYFRTAHAFRIVNFYLIFYYLCEIIVNL